jgi:hypothetical protein
MTERSNIGKNNNAITRESHASSFDSVCTCDGCDHEFARDCLKAKCTCCKEYNHSIVLDGMDGFEPTNKENTSEIR